MINIIFEKGLKGFKKGAFAYVAAEALRFEGIKDDGIELNILFTDDNGIRELNSRFLGRDEPTDVISFGSKRKGFFGEIAISTETAQYNARRFGTTLKTELFLYIIHGVLHLLGYNDEGHKKRAVMRKRQEAILKALDRA